MLFDRNSHTYLCLDVKKIYFCSNYSSYSSWSTRSNSWVRRRDSEWIVIFHTLVVSARCFPYSNVLGSESVSVASLRASVMFSTQVCQYIVLIFQNKWLTYSWILIIQFFTEIARSIASNALQLWNKSVFYLRKIIQIQIDDPQTLQDVPFLSFRIFFPFVWRVLIKFTVITRIKWKWHNMYRKYFMLF